MYLSNTIFSILIWSVITSYSAFFGKDPNDIDSAFPTFQRTNDFLYPLNDPELRLTKVKNLSNWYDPIASCMIRHNHTVNDTYWSILGACQRNHSNVLPLFRDGFGE